MVQPELAAPASDEALHARYEAYCAEQAAALPGLLPREGLRALYRSARAEVTGEVVDPLALLVARCRALLPLPPFEVWAADYLRDRRPYLEPVEEGTAGGMRSVPVTVDLRSIEHAGAAWVASLAVFREPPEWRGFISFHPAAQAVAPGRPLQRTTDIFLEPRAEDVQSRFRAFSDDTLQAFLRSTLP
jgi:hypothetical protein